jgi:AcrR family transcriptional regulator
MRFSARRFEAITVRAVARDASVDPALILCYFASKARLFPAAMGDGQSTADIVRQAVGGTRPGPSDGWSRLLYPDRPGASLLHGRDARPGPHD